MPEILHASLIAVRVMGEWRGVLFEGPSGVGKSDLALRCLAAGFSLVADDRVVVFASDGSAWGRSTETLAGLIEVRGVGILSATPLPFCRIALSVTLATSPTEVERLPTVASRTLAGRSVPAVRLWPFDAAAPARLRALLAGDARDPDGPVGELLGGRR